MLNKLTLDNKFINQI